MEPKISNDPADPLLTIAETAADLKCSESFLAKARMTGTGPAYVQLGRAVRYRRSALEAYKAVQTRTSTSHNVSSGQTRLRRQKNDRKRGKALEEDSPDLLSGLSISVHDDTLQYIK